MITAVVLTFNEELHLKRCLENLSKICERVVIVDSYSTDNTKEIAMTYPFVDFYEHKWLNYSSQFNWALENCDINSAWTLRMDADEYLSNDLIDELHQMLSVNQIELNAIYLPLRRFFLGKEIKYSSGTIYLLRLFRTGMGRMERRWMDEHVEVTTGQSLKARYWFADDNLNSIIWWTNKHVNYAMREAVDLLSEKWDSENSKIINDKLFGQVAFKRRLKKFYSNQPRVLRAFIYFIYRYVYKLGFLDGKAGFLWCFLQAWWYRTLIDIIYEEVSSRPLLEQKSYLNDRYNFDLFEEES